MLRIRLRRVGAKKQPSYRIVVAEKTSPRDGRFVEVIGFYNPRTEPETVTIKEERALHWLTVGAQPSDPVVRLLKNNGTLERFTRLKAGESLEELLAEEQVDKASRAVIADVKPEPEPEPEDEVEVVDIADETEDAAMEAEDTDESTEDTDESTEDSSEDETAESTEEDEVQSEEEDA